MSESEFNKAIRDFANTLKNIPNSKTSPYDTQAEVKRIDGNIAWVHIPGGVDETPVQLTTSAKKGDMVQVRVSGGQAWLYGNATAPPTDDTTAKQVGENLKATVFEVDRIVEHITEIDKLIAKSITVDELEAGTISAVLISAINLAVSGQIDAARINVNELAATQAFIEALNSYVINTNVLTANNIKTERLSADIIEAINTSTATLYASRIILTDPETGETYVIQPATVYEMADPQPTSDTWNNGSGCYLLVDGVYVEQTGQSLDITKTYYEEQTVERQEKINGNIIEPLTITADKIQAGAIGTEQLGIGQYMNFGYGKKLTESQPSNWSTNWKDYFVKDVGEDNYKPVDDTVCPTWEANTYYTKDGDNPQMVIGDKNSFAVTVDKKQITFWYAQQKVAFINGDRMEIPRSVMLEEMFIGQDKWSWREHNDNLCLKWVG